VCFEGSRFSGRVFIRPGKPAALLILRGFGLIVFINRGLITGQAVAALIEDYFDKLKINRYYENFNVKVTMSYPFADLIMDEGLKAADTFPAVVVSATDDNVPPDLENLPPQDDFGGFDDAGLDEILDVYEHDADGLPTGEKKAGVSAIIAAENLAALRETIKERGLVYGRIYSVHRRDRISIAIWAENGQVKDEIYKQLRMFLTGSFADVLSDTYEGFIDPAASFVPSEVTGEPANIYNIDFDVVLFGAHLGFDIDYFEEQYVFDTEIDGSRPELIIRGKNYVKEN